MSRLLNIFAASAGAAAAMMPAPAAAQQPQGNMAEIIVYGNDPCPRSTDDQVVVCARRPEAERYRLPPKYRPSGTRQETDSWVNRSQVLQTVGDTGINSCSAVGPAGFTGCEIQRIKQAKEQRKQQAEDNQPPE